MTRTPDIQHKQKENNTMKTPKTISEAAKVVAERNGKTASKGKAKTTTPARRNMTIDEARRTLEMMKQIKEAMKQVEKYSAELERKAKNVLAKH